MKRAIAAFGVWLVAGAPHALVAAERIVVSPSGPHRSVAEAVRGASAGSTIVIRAGTYREPPIVVDRPLTIVGEGRPKIEALQAATLIRVVSDDVTIRGLVLGGIQPSHVDDRAAVRFERVHRCVVEETEIHDSPFAIVISESSGCRVERNVIRGTGDRRSALGNAIHLWSARDVTVAGNDVSGHRDGLYFEFVQDARVEGNRSSGNARYGLHFMFSHHCVYRNNRLERNGAGVAVMYTHDVEMTGNTFADNRGPTAYGLLLKDISDSRLTGNHFTGNTVGLHIEGGGHLNVLDNQFSRNGWAIRLMANSPGNRFEGNVFQANSFDMSTNSRSTTAVVSGNYWDRYRGYDLNRDGKGDVAFRPVRLFSLLVASQPPSVILMRSAFVDVLDATERALPVLTPGTLVDPAPLMAVAR